MGASSATAAPSPAQSGPTKTKAYIKVEKRSQLSNEGQYSIDAEGKRVFFCTPGTKAWLAVAKAQNSLHTAVFFEGPVQIGDTMCKYMLCHLVPDQIRIEGDDNLATLEQRVKAWAGSSTAQMYKGSATTCDPSKYPLSLFVSECCPLIFGSDGSLNKFQMQMGMLNGVINGTCSAADTPAAYKLSSSSSSSGVDAVAHYKESFTNCKRFGNVVSLTFRIPMPDELRAVQARLECIPEE